MEKILLHCCCAPCTSYVLEFLSQDYDCTLFFYNPNISTKIEYDKRLDELFRYNKDAGFNVPIIEFGYEENIFYNAVKGYEKEPERGKRCEICFRLRLSKTAELFPKNDFAFFTTTLTVSPHKNVTQINTVGAEFEGYRSSDFKKKNGYKRSIELSKQYNLYRQNFCGCVFSQQNQ
ncbi:MAG: epoxyqueuosine reductase QueH [Oscillospiraceae bacterium]|jgi:predicted adenine nucleotide alpha hydrolase (AANH) superfamily ATPase|nr:epoxyqueuosine reductase QueH [Oscillospiraceae bacterium]